MKRILIILALVIQYASGYAAMAPDSSADSLLNELRKLPHDSTRLMQLEKLVLREQASPHYIDYAEEMFNEAQLQKNDTYIASSTYYKLLHYYNSDDLDSVNKLVSDLLPLAERLEYWQMYFSAQKLHIYTYIFKEKFEFAINEALKMKEKAEVLDNASGRIAAYLCLANAYHETHRTKEEGEVLKKAYDVLLTKPIHDSSKINILAQLIIFSYDVKAYENLKKYLDQNERLLTDMLEKAPEMHESYFNLFLFSEIYNIYYYTGIEKADSARIHIEKAKKYITPQSFFPYVVSYRDACILYYQYIKDYSKALLYADSTLADIRKPEFRQIDYARQLSRKANLLKDMGDFEDALPLYAESNRIQDSLAVAISAKQLEEIKDIYHLNQLVWEQGQLRSRLQLCILACLCIILALCIAYMLRINRIRKALKISEKETQIAKQQTEEVNEMKNRFLSNISHAIRVPLNGVLGFSQIITNEMDLDEESRKEYAAIIQQNTEQLMRLVNNVLDLSRLEAGMMKFQMNDYDIIQLCNDAIGMAQMQSPNPEIRFQSNIDECIIHTDINRFTEVIVSILNCPLASFKEVRSLNFTLEKNEEMLYFKIIGSLLADLKYANQDTALRNDVNLLFIRHFGGTYQVIPDGDEGPTILFTYPANTAQ